jgi:hypothetical protein
LGKNVSKRQQQQGLGGKQLGRPTASELTLWWPLVQLSTGCKQKCKEKCSSCPKLQVHFEDLVELALWPTMPSLQNHFSPHTRAQTNSRFERHSLYQGTNLYVRFFFSFLICLLSDPQQLDFGMSIPFLSLSRKSFMLHAGSR